MVNPPNSGFGSDVDIKHTFSRNSWHAKLNRYIYGWSYVENVDCLCPYFWGTILAILALPLWLMGRGICKIVYLIEDQGWKLPRYHINRNIKDSINKIIGYGCLFVFVMIVTIALGLSIITHGLLVVLFWIFCGVAVIGGLIGLVFLAYEINNRYNDWREEHPKSHRPNIVLQYIKAKKDKHCPRVIWKN